MLTISMIAWLYMLDVIWSLNSWDYWLYESDIFILMMFVDEGMRMRLFVDGGITNEAIRGFGGITNEDIRGCVYHFLVDKILFVEIVYHIIIWDWPGIKYHAMLVYGYHLLYHTYVRHASHVIYFLYVNRLVASSTQYWAKLRSMVGR